MKNLLTIITLALGSTLLAQGNSEFRAALASEIQRMQDDESIIVEYKKTGCWGDYEGGYINFTQSDAHIDIALSNTNQHFKESETSKTRLEKKELLARLNSKIDTRSSDAENTVYSNFIEYNITKNGVSLAVIRTTIEPDQVTNKIGLVPKFQDFLNQNKSKKSGIIINNISGY
ncbi:MAG: hypothetical protein KJP00_02085 [Bacteroidia bacterium]|nr:hypothetical protein [Bacteroidia bacterium]